MVDHWELATEMPPTTRGASWLTPFPCRRPISGTDRTLTFETGKLAQLADGAVVARIGDTVVLATATAARSVREGTDFFPLTVDIEERTYAAGKIPGSFFRREGKASDQAILTCRLIDRPLRPSFPEGFRNEVQVVGTIFGADQDNPHDVAGHQRRLGRAHGLGHPLRRPDRRGAGRLHRPTGTWIPHPTYQEGDESTFELVVAGRALTEADDADDRHHDGRGRRHRAVVGATTRRARPRSPRRSSPTGLEAAKTWIRESIDLQRQLVAAYVAARGPDRAHRVLDVRPTTATTCGPGSRRSAPTPIAKANAITAKAERNAALDEADQAIIEPRWPTSSPSGPARSRRPSGR